MKGQRNSFIIAAVKFKSEHPRLIMTVLMLMIIPISASLILGYEMKADVAVTIPTVIMDSDKSGFSENYIGYIKNSPYFNIVKYADSYDKVEEAIYEGKAYVGVIIPENFYKDMQAGKAPKILTVYDGSTMAVIVSSKASMMEILLTVKAGYMASIYEGKQSVVPGQVMNQVMPLDTTIRTLYNPVKSFRNFVLPGLLAAIVQVAIAITGAERGWENQRKNLLFREHLKVILQWSLAGSLSMFLTLAIQWLIFGMPYRGTIPGGILLTLLFSICITLLGYMMGSFFDERTFCTQISCILVLPTAILGGYTWPVLAMPAAMQYLAKAIPFTYYSESIRNLCLKPMRMNHLLPDFIAMSVFLLAGIITLYLIKTVRDKKLTEAGVMTP
ncbi:ABC transporter permease [Sinanaerobacter chloroacetimidivorans]|jgi:ABC-2 type transport system permease protein|uniref:ABC transporter permease n=1 Tax=Sinanaerobacter chloroacetimidivorans TaxID=2818044 RepID=A0A8J8B4I4_9FIRM|nr:ABC transporter permease [Sinanaerobacter chloroacetimidivorans]MBR0599380.1 ABC transporter permease [Sinanaerobacter chloroacetimidivorans]